MSRVIDKEVGLDNFGAEIRKGDKVIGIKTGWKGSQHDLYKGTVMRITDYGAWIKPDEEFNKMFWFGFPRYKKYVYNSITKEYDRKTYEHSWWKFQYRKTIIKL